MKYLLDTNIISEVFKKIPNHRVIQWLDSVPADEAYISVLTLGEIRKGIEKLSAQKKKIRLVQWLERDLPRWFESRTLSINEAIADKWGILEASVEKTLPAIDLLIASTALCHDMTLVTRNTDEFPIPGLQILNPFEY